MYKNSPDICMLTAPSRSVGLHLCWSNNTRPSFLHSIDSHVKTSVHSSSLSTLASLSPPQSKWACGQIAPKHVLSVFL